MRTIISATTASAISDTFRVNKGEIISVVADGLAGAETAQLQIETGSDRFIDVPEATATLTAALPTTTVVAIGHYRITKPDTLAATSVAIGD